MTSHPAAALGHQRIDPRWNEQIDSRCPTTYTWSYHSSLEDLRALYNKAKHEQWDGQTLLDWTVDVDPEKELFPDAANAVYGTPMWDKLTPTEVKKMRRYFMSWTLSQFLHGEQGALLATAQIVSTVPMPEAKYFASTQVMDEARHVEVYDKYLREKVGETFPINRHLRQLLDQILSDPRWDMKYLGMQILVEGLALASFKFIHGFVDEPLLKDLTHNVMRDEARHVAFGMLSLSNFYNNELNEKELREREEFVYEACRLMRDRFLGEEVWQKMGMPVDKCLDAAMHSPTTAHFRALLFSRIVPNIKRLNLLTPWLREKFQELGILQFEDMVVDDEAELG